MTFSDINAALRMRELISTVAEDVVERLRPQEKIGKVYFFDESRQIAQIWFPGETLNGLVTVRFARDKIPRVQMSTTFDVDGYNAPGDIVRVAGKPGAYYILDFVSGSPAAAEDFADTEWIALPLTSPWVNYAGWQAARYRRKNGIVYLQGLIQSGAQGSQIAVLPAGFRPSGSLIFASDGYNAHARIDVHAAGAVNFSIGSGAHVTLSPVFFIAEG